MQHTRSAAHPLNYFQQSPVRGQLEPSDGFARTGWRYLQCTDTPNELRVLLPPRTALVYSYLLKAESLELEKGKEAAWDRVIQIRHLKDRMIRKCQRLARDSSNFDKNTGRMLMFTTQAPPDFRLKEMERWFRDQGSDFVQKMTGNASSSSSTVAHPAFCCNRCGPLGVQSAPSHKTKAAATGASSVSRTVSRSNSGATRSTTPTRMRSMSQSIPRSRAAVEGKRSQGKSSAKPQHAARVPERVPKRPSGSSSDTAVEKEKEQFQKATKEFLKQQPTPTVSRSNSSRSTGPISKVPAVIRQPDAPPAIAHQPISPPPVARSPSPLPVLIRQRVSPPPVARSLSPPPAVIRQPESPPAAAAPLDTAPPALSPQRSAESLKSRSSAHSGVSGTRPARMSIQSPEPLPIPYRLREHNIALPPSDAGSVPGSPALLPMRAASPEPPRAASPDSTLIDAEGDPEGSPRPSEPPTTGQPLETIQERPEDSDVGHGGRPLIRRRSSLKKRDSMSRLSAASGGKSVTWAMDRDWTEQMSRFVKSTNEAEVAAYELGELRVQYQEEIGMMRVVCHDAIVAAQHLGLDVDMLKREAVALAEQENKVNAITDHMERKESHYREKVMNVLEETRRVVQLCDKKRDQQDA